MRQNLVTRCARNMRSATLLVKTEYFGVLRRWAKRDIAACGRNRWHAEVKKQGELRRAPSEQVDHVSEGSAADIQGLFW